MVFQRKDWLFLFGLLVSLFLFYPSLFLVKAAPLSGDHLEQHYPWAYLLAKSIKSWKLPFWTNSIHVGFPITAEAQIGTFYLPNLLLYFLLPFKTAYSYMNLIHYWIAGIGTYLYSRQVKLGSFASFVASFIFLFGSAYGGAFYNITSLKTIAWFPVILFFFERLVQNGAWKHVLFLSFSISLSLLAGYPQVGIYTLGIFILYVLLRIFGLRTKGEQINVSALIALMGALFAALIMCSPQIVLSLQLAFLSTRVQLTEDYVYVGSMPPLAILTIFFPVLQGFVRGNCLYNGLAPIFLILIGFYSKEVRKNWAFKIWLLIGLFSLFLALGEWSPIYIALIKLTQFYSFRTPSKFLVYFCFSVAMLAGIGTERLKGSSNDRSKIQKPANTYLVLIGLAVVFYGFIYTAVMYGRNLVEPLGKWVIQHFVYGRAGHPHSLDSYYEKLRITLDTARSVLSFQDPYNIFTMLIILFSVFAVLILKNNNRRFAIGWIFLFLFVDLRYFAEIDMKKDFKPYTILDKSSPVVESLKSEIKDQKVMRVLGFRKYGKVLPIAPSENILYGYDDIGAYSPFVTKRYFDSIGQFGNINDSNFAFSPDVSFLEERVKLLNFLGVSHILSTVSIDASEFELIARDDSSYFYKNKDTVLPVHFVSQFEVLLNWDQVKNRLMSPDFDPSKILLIEQEDFRKLSALGVNLIFHSNVSADYQLKKKSESEEVWMLNTKGSGFFVISKTMYPGWDVAVNEQKAVLVRAFGLFQAVWIPKAGTYEIIFTYQPKFELERF